VAATKAEVANGANVARPEPVRSDSQKNEVEAHDDGPSRVVGPDERPTRALFPASYIAATEINLILL